jgi:hypothetical protein
MYNVHTVKTLHILYSYIIQYTSTWQGDDSHLRRNRFFPPGATQVGGEPLTCPTKKPQGDDSAHLTAIFKPFYILRFFDDWWIKFYMVFWIGHLKFLFDYIWLAKQKIQSVNMADVQYMFNLVSRSYFIKCCKLFCLTFFCSKHRFLIYSMKGISFTIHQIPDPYPDTSKSPDPRCDLIHIATLHKIYFSFCSFHFFRSVV